ncbi:MAG: hypothetical protein ACK5VW_01255 [Holosporales bacterium]
MRNKNFIIISMSIMALVVLIPDQVMALGDHINTIFEGEHKANTGSKFSSLLLLTEAALVLTGFGSGAALIYKARPWLGTGSIVAGGLIVPIGFSLVNAKGLLIP